MAAARIAILASGGGTTAEAFIKAVAKKQVDAKVVSVIVNNSGSAIFEKIDKLNKSLGLDIKVCHIGKKNFPPDENEELEYGHQTLGEERAILERLEEDKIDLVLLLGYMKLIGKSIVEKYGWRDNYQSVYQGRMINTHPGLLPATKGLFGIHVQEKVLGSGLQAGHSLFIVDSAYDDGPVVAKHQVAVMPSDTAEVLFERVKDSERTNLARDINAFIVEQKKYLGVK